MRRLILIAIVIAVAGCGASQPLPDGRRTITFDSGSPIVDVEAFPELDGDSLRLRITWGIIPASLIQANRTFGLESIARSEIDVHAIGQGEGTSFSRTDTLRYYDDRAGADFDYNILQRDLDLAPGSYEVAVRVEDATSGASTRRMLTTTLPAGDDAEASCHLRLKSSEDAGAPRVAFHVDSAAEWVDVVAESWGRPAEMELALVRLESDTSVAEPPFGLRRTRVALSVRGVAAEDVDTVEVRRWEQGEDPRQQVIRMEPDEIGLYRALCIREGETLATREFAVRQAGFPRVDRLSVMLDALEYLATPREMRHLRDAPNEFELKLRLDSFWTEHAPNRLVASDLVERYYSRVQRANMLFSDVKEGWKTDRGMVYILRGPPLYVDRHVQSETWYYTYSEMNPADIFVFDRVVIDGLDAISRNVVLQRGRVYDYDWRRLRDRWRRGEDV